MVDSNIFDGDVIIIERYESAENGETAVVLINNQEVTLKKLFIEKSGVRLQPANDSMPPIYLKNEDVQVLGLVMGVMIIPFVSSMADDSIAAATRGSRLFRRVPRSIGTATKAGSTRTSQT